MEHRGTKRMETERLLLRPFEPTDGAAMYRNWASDPEVTRYLTWQVHGSERDSARLASEWAAESERPDVYQWAIVLKSLGEPIGSISAMHFDGAVASAELGWCIGRRWWGRGIMPEAAEAVVHYLIREVGLNRVCARHDVENKKSGRVMQKLGMTREGVLRASGRNGRGVVDMVWYSVLADELK